MSSEDKKKRQLSPYPGTGNQPNESVSAEPADKGLEAVIGALRYLFIGLRVLIVVLLFAFFFGAFVGLEKFGGFFYIDEHEEAMLFRFGRLTPVTVEGESREVFGSGVLRWRWPYPVDEVQRIGTQRPVVVETRHFWPHAETRELDPMADEPVDIEQGLRPGYDGYLLTGDTNIMHMRWMLTYQIVDPKSYYLEMNQERIGDPAPEQLTDRRPLAPEVMIRNLLEQAVLQEAAAWSVDEVWRRSRTRGREEAAEPSAAPVEPPDILLDEQMSEEELEIPLPDLEVSEEEAQAMYREFLTQAVRERVIRLIAENDMGIRVQEVNLLDSQPPRPALQSFLEVNQAAQQYRQKLDEARGYRTRTLAEARTKANEIMAEGEAYQSRIIARGKADSEVFEQIRRQYLLSPESVLVALYSDTLRTILPEVEAKYIMPTGEGISQEVRLLLGPEGRRWIEDD